MRPTGCTAERLLRNRPCHTGLLASVGALALATAVGAQLGTPTTFGGSFVDDGEIGISAIAADLDGDGRDELVYGSSRRYDGSTGSGAVTVLTLQGCGGSQSVTYNQENFGYTSSAGDLFGASFAAGDFNGDTHVDLAIGLPGQAVADGGGILRQNAGAVLVVYGTAIGLDPSDREVFTQAGPVLDTPEAGDLFGSALLAADFNGDEIDDLVIAAVGEDVVPSGGGLNQQDAGTVHILYGSADGPSTDGDMRLNQEVPGVSNSADDDDLFGHALAVGDFSGDGHLDLAVGVPGESIGGLGNAGAVQIFLGSANGLTTASQFWHQAVPGLGSTNSTDDEFGFALAAGDFDGNGTDDLAVGVPGDEEGQGLGLDEVGRVLVLRGAPGSGLDASLRVGIPGSVLGDLHNFDRVGEALVSGDFDGNGIDDLAVAAPLMNVDEVVNSGIVAVIYGVLGLGPVPGASTQHLDAASVLGGALDLGGEFGHAMAAGSFRGTPGDGLFVGEPGRDHSNGSTNAGRIYEVQSVFPMADDFETGSLCRWSSFVL